MRELTRRLMVIVSAAAMLVSAVAVADESDGVLAIDVPAPSFKLPTLSGKEVSLADFNPGGPVVILVLRGYPGYQCPLCTRQVGEWIRSAAKIEAAGARVLLVYPGPSDGLKGGLKGKADEFFRSAEMPESFDVAIDAGYQFTNAYGLRWVASRETAYPSTIVLDKAGIIRFASVSKTHGDRVSAETLITELRKIE